MNRQVERIENYPDVKTKLLQHIQETHEQIARLERILESLGESRSVLKDNALSLTGNMAAITHALTQDEIIKNSIANFAFENYEIASYKSLIELAGETGHQEAEQPLRETLREEEAMANWLDGPLAGHDLHLSRAVRSRPEGPPLSMNSGALAPGGHTGMTCS